MHSTKTYRSWFSSWVRSVLTGLVAVKVRRSAGMVKFGESRDLGVASAGGVGGSESFVWYANTDGS
jgi:hypothetical protein